MAIPRHQGVRRFDRAGNIKTKEHEVEEESLLW